MANKTCGECKHFEVDVIAAKCKKKLQIIDDNTPACKKFDQKPFTNGDKIRKMDNSDLIDVIVCPYPGEVCIHRSMHGYACKCCKRDWLHAPAKDGDDGAGR